MGRLSFWLVRTESVLPQNSSRASQSHSHAVIALQRDLQARIEPMMLAANHRRIAFVWMCLWRRVAIAYLSVNVSFGNSVVT
jgi:hypothetical protein